MGNFSITTSNVIGFLPYTNEYLAGCFLQEKLLLPRLHLDINYMKITYSIQLIHPEIGKINFCSSSFRKYQILNALFSLLTKTSVI